MSWKLLERFLASEIFGSDPSICVAYLSRYAHHVGIQYVLCNKLRNFSYPEIEFFLPQLCHLLVSIESESMALEDFIIDLCHESVSGALITFWLFQAALSDLKGDPQSNAFRTCRRLYNKAQSIVFGASPTHRPEKIRENILPTTVLASIVLASVAVPGLPSSLGPLAVAQARRPRPAEETISETPAIQQKLSKSRTHSGSSVRQKRRSTNHSRGSSKDVPFSPTAAENVGRPSRGSVSKRPPSAGKASLKSVTHSRHTSLSKVPTTTQHHSNAASVSELPQTPISAPDVGSGYKFPPLRPTLDDRRRHSHVHESELRSRVNLTSEQKSNLLRAHYFRSETSFLQALEDISNRLVALPKPARLSALRAELALVARDLPAEVDIPVIDPATLEDGLPSHSKHHRIVRLNPAESTSLNSAERVPYLLILEVLRDDFDFDPESDANQRLLTALTASKPGGRRRLFDITAAQTSPVEYESTTTNVDSVFEPALGDLSSPDLLRDYSDGVQNPSKPEQRPQPASRSLGSRTPPRLSSGANTVSSYSLLSTPRTSEMPISRSDSPTPRNYGKDQPDFSALATHMRTAAQMLAQLDISSSKRPRQEVEAIKAKIIANMRTLEEQNFNIDDETDADATFDAIMENTNAASNGQPTTSLDKSTAQNDGRGSADPSHDTAAGIARTENDQKTGGIRRKGDREDPSYALFGEDWATKRERIRRTSPYGFMRNWDLLSMIVKTGSDLRQELFACQMIHICSNIWAEADVPVWVRNMRILVTGENSGLIETITNGVSLHSLKRSLTLSSIAAGTNPRRRFATLKDHFLKTFGPDEASEAFRAGQDAFLRSLAAYSVLSYVLQLKDRHNGNLLIDNAGHIIHIDFGFMLSNSPGSMGFEAAPFKLTAEYVDVLGGAQSPGWDAFRSLCKRAFLALRKSADQIVSVVDLMGKDSRMACFQGIAGGPAAVVSSLKARFVLHMSEKECEAFVDELISKSLGSYYTRLYDVFQYRTQGIY